MTSLRDILYKVRIQEVFGNTDLEINSITADYRSISKGSLFVAVKGSVSDGHKYIDNAIS